MLAIVSPQEAARMIDGFMLGAVMQQDPFLEEFGSLPEEPPDEEPCWDVKPKEEPCWDVKPKEEPCWDVKPKEEPCLEQGTLFDFPSPEPTKPRATHPVRSQKPTKPVTPSARHDEIPPPYVPRHITYDEYLKVFNGDHSLTLYWFNQQAIKE